MQSQIVFLQSFIRNLVINGDAPVIRFFKLTYGTSPVARLIDWLIEFVDRSERCSVGSWTVSRSVTTGQAAGDSTRSWVFCSWCRHLTGSLFIVLFNIYFRPKSIHQFPRSKSVTSWRLLHSKTTTSPQHKWQVHNKLARAKVHCVCCVASFPKLQRLVADLLAVSLISPQQVCNKLATQPHWPLHADMVDHPPVRLASRQPVVL